MLFQSLQFLYFFLVVFGVYSVIRPFRLPRNVVLLAASYYFYGSWNWHYVWLLAFCTLTSWVATRMIEREREPKRRLLLMWAGVGANLLVLGVFKYLNFFSAIASQISSAITGGGFDALRILLPVGISFYTFQAISHIVDVYRRDDTHCGNPLEYALYISFFPQLVAGPIERAGHIIPQLREPKQFSPGDIELGLYLVIWGSSSSRTISHRSPMRFSAVQRNPPVSRSSSASLRSPSRSTATSRDTRTSHAASGSSSGSNFP